MQKVCKTIGGPQIALRYPKGKPSVRFPKGKPLARLDGMLFHTPRVLPTGAPKPPHQGGFFYFVNVSIILRENGEFNIQDEFNFPVQW